MIKGSYRKLVTSSMGIPFGINKLAEIIERIFIRNNGKIGWDSWRPTDEEWNGSNFNMTFTVGKKHYRLDIEEWAPRTPEENFSYYNRRKYHESNNT